MLQRAPRPDAPVPGECDLGAYVLVQVSPAYRVLAVSTYRPRLVDEMEELHTVDSALGVDPELRFAIWAANVLV